MAGDDRLEVVGDAQAADNEVDVFDGRRGGDCHTYAAFVESFKQLEGAGEGFYVLTDDAAEGGFFFPGDGFYFFRGYLFAEDVFDDGVVPDAEAALEVGLGEVNAPFGEGFLPGAEVVRGGVGKDSVHIPDDGGDFRH